MKRFNRLLMVATIAVLLLPAAVIGPLAEGCCGVEPTSLQVGDAPDPVCFDQGGKVTISGTYTVQPLWDPFEAYETGVVVKIWDPNGALVADQNLGLGVGETVAPKNFQFSTQFQPAMTGVFPYEVVAWSVTSWGREETDVVGGSFTAEVCNKPPDCSKAAPSQGTLWPPNHEFAAINVLGVTDPDGDPVTITIDKIFQDEPVNTTGDGAFVPDGKGVGTATAEVRAERVGTPKVPGDGRFYHIGFTAADGRGGSCTGEVLVSVPHDQDKAPVDGGPLFDSTTP